MLLSSADLSWMRDMQEQAMPGAVVIERYVLTSANTGGYTEAWTAVGTVMGRIYPVTRRGITEPVVGAMPTSITRWMGTLPNGTDVTAKDRLLYQSRTWEVLTVNNDEMWSTATRCELESLNEERRA